MKVTEWPPIGKIAAHSAYEMFSWYMCLIVSLVFSHLDFWSGSLFLIAPFPDLCLLVLFYIFNNFVQNLDCWYPLEPLRRGGIKFSVVKTSRSNNLLV